jgi:hypothetical protein
VGPYLRDPPALGVPGSCPSATAKAGALNAWPATKQPAPRSLAASVTTETRDRAPRGRVYPTRVRTGRMWA